MRDLSRKKGKRQKAFSEKPWWVSRNKWMLHCIQDNIDHSMLVLYGIETAMGKINEKIGLQNKAISECMQTAAEGLNETKGIGLQMGLVAQSLTTLLAEKGDNNRMIMKAEIFNQEKASAVLAMVEMMNNGVSKEEAKKELLVHGFDETEATAIMAEAV